MFTGAEREDPNCTQTSSVKTRQPAVFLALLADWTTLLSICHKQSISVFCSLPFRARSC